MFSSKALHPSDIKPSVRMLLDNEQWTPHQQVQRGKKKGDANVLPKLLRSRHDSAAQAQKGRAESAISGP